INCVQVGGRVGSDNTLAANIVYRLKSQTAGTVLESQSVTVAANFWSVHRGQSPRPYMLTSYADPEDDSEWTADKLNNMQIGVRANVSQTTVRRVSTLWALVDFRSDSSRRRREPCWSPSRSPWPQTSGRYTEASPLGRTCSLRTPTPRTTANGRRTS